MGYQVWVANLNDKNGDPDMSTLFNLQPAAQVDGQESWKTNLFGVGTETDKGKRYWIYVFLVPDSVGSVLENVRLPEDWGVSLDGPIEDVAVVTRIPVERTAADTCPP